MLRALAAGLAMAALALAAAPGARGEAALPARDLRVELRSAEAPTGSAWDLHSADAARDRIAHGVRVRNGEAASLRLSTLRPVQAWQVLPGLWRGNVAPSTQWIEASQTLVVQPRWPGGARPVAVALRATAAHFDPAVAPGSAAPPERREASLATAVDVALGEWVVIATSGDTQAAPGSAVSTRDAGASSRTLQLRVRLAP